MANPMTEPHPPGVLKKHLISFSVVFSVSSLFYWALAARTLDLSLPELARQFKDLLYYPNMNLCVVGEINGHNVLTLFYYFLIFVLMMMGGYFTLFIYDHRQTHTISFQQIVSAVGLICLLIFSGIQQMHRTDHFKYEQASFHQKSRTDK